MPGAGPASLRGSHSVPDDERETEADRNQREMPRSAAWFEQWRPMRDRKGYVHLWEQERTVEHGTRPEWLP